MEPMQVDRRQYPSFFVAAEKYSESTCVERNVSRLATISQELRRGHASVTVCVLHEA